MIITLEMLPFIPPHFLCTDFWQLVHCIELLPTHLSQAPHGHLAPPQRTARSVHMHFHTTMQQSLQWLQWDAHIYPQNSPFTFDDHYLHLIHRSLDQPHSPSQMAYGSNQPCCHNTLSGQTDRQSKRQTDRRTYGMGNNCITRVLVMLTLYG